MNIHLGAEISMTLYRSTHTIIFTLKFEFLFLWLSYLLGLLQWARLTDFQVHDETFKDFPV